MRIKQELFKQCIAFVNNRADTVEAIISSNQKALQTETKSSAGDKHETGRAMLQLEMEKASQQLSGIHQMKEVLSKINLNSTTEIAHLGSVIETASVNYFLAISAGKITVNATIYYAVSVSSPIGKLLLGKRVTDELVFNGKKIIINKIN